MIPDIFDIVAGLQDGRFTQEQAVNWLNQHMQSYYDKEHDQERRRRVFDQYVLRLVGTPGEEENLARWNWEIIHAHVEILLSESERFASKEKE